jgi:hypothetical protein
LPIYIGNEFGKLDPLNIFRNFSAIRGTDGCGLDARLRMVGDIYFSKEEGDALSNRAPGCEGVAQ